MFLSMIGLFESWKLTVAPGAQPLGAGAGLIDKID